MAEIKNRLKAAWAAFHEYRQELTSKTSPMPQITLVQHGDHADIDIREWNMDINKDARKDDQICSTNNSSPHRPNERTIQNEDEERYNRKVSERGRKTKGNDPL